MANGLFLVFRMPQAVVTCFANENALLKRAKELNAMLELERENIKRRIAEAHEAQEDNEQLEKETKQIKNEVDQLQMELNLSRFELEELQTQKKDYEERRKQHEKRQLAEILPRKEELQRRIAQYKQELEELALSKVTAVGAAEWPGRGCERSARRGAEKWLS